MDAKIMATKIKDKAYGISSPYDSYSKIINKLNISIAYAKKSANTAISKIESLTKK